MRPLFKGERGDRSFLEEQVTLRLGHTGIGQFCQNDRLCLSRVGLRRFDVHLAVIGADVRQRERVCPILSLRRSNHVAGCFMVRKLQGVRF